MGTIRTGVGGWEYELWAGPWFPAGLKKADRLPYSAGRFATLEINATFYKTQTPATFARWAGAVPDGFRFAVKAPRYATNRRVLGEAGDSIARFVDSGLAELGDRLGPILWQFAPTKRFDPDDMSAFVALLPAAATGVPLRHALEVRHASFVDPVFTAIAAKAGVAIVCADHDVHPMIDEPTAAFSYARLLRSREDEFTGYPEDELRAWAERTSTWAARGEAYVYFIGGDKVRAPAAADAFGTLTGG